MKAARIVQLVLLGLLVFGLGAGVAYWQRTRAPSSTAAEITAAMTAGDSAATDSAEGMPRVAESQEQAGVPPIESGTIVADAPPMPAVEGQETAATTPEAAAATDAATGAETGANPTPGEVFSQASSAAAETPVAGMQVGGPFTLTDHNGNVVTEASWPDKYKLVFFGFTSCPDVCPAALQKISAFMDSYDPEAKKIQPLFITTDPKQDTQDVMKTYAEGYTHVLGLTGTPEQLSAAYEAYKVYAAGENHSALVYFMAPSGEFLAVFDSHVSTEEMLGRVAKVVEGAAE